MPRGGPRPGAGRKKNAPNKATAERQAKVAASGQTPLDVMLEAMRFFRGLAARETAKGEDANSKIVRDNLSLAAEIAKDAARYVHPALATTTLRGDDNKPVRAHVMVEYV